LAVTEPGAAPDSGSDTGAAGTRKVSARAILALLAVAVVAYLLDQFTKFLVVSNLTENQPVEVLGPILQWHFVRNSGAAFSFANGYTWIFSIAATAVTVFIVIFARRIHSTAWAVLFGMLLGGTTGNLTDRLFREPGFGVGHVVDFVQVYGFPGIFNVADSFIVASMGLFLILTIKGIGLDGRRPIPAAPSAPASQRPAEPGSSPAESGSSPAGPGSSPAGPDVRRAEPESSAAETA